MYTELFLLVEKQMCMYFERNMFQVLSNFDKLINI